MVFEALGPRGAAILDELQNRNGPGELQRSDESNEDPESLEALDSLADR
jgi:hypothetical protein